MFLGCAAVYAARTAMPLCIVAIGQEMNWDKTDSVSLALLDAFTSKLALLLISDSKTCVVLNFYYRGRYPT